MLRRGENAHHQVRHSLPSPRSLTLCQERNVSGICLKRSVVRSTVFKTWLLTFMKFALAQFGVGLSWPVFQVCERSPSRCWQWGKELWKGLNVARDSFVYYHSSSSTSQGQQSDVISQELYVSPDTCLSAGRMRMDFVLGLEPSSRPRGWLYCCHML